MKKTAIVIGVLALMGLLAYPIFAGNGFYGKGAGMMGRNWGNGGQCGAGPQNWDNDLTKEQIQQLQDLQQKFRDQTQQTRAELRAKQAELFALLGAVKPDQSKALGVQKEISELQAKLSQERIKHQFEVRKIVPDAGFGRMGLGMMAGRGQGRMGMRGFYGNGPCFDDTND